MIHELIDPRKKSNKVNAPKNTKTILDSNAVLGECNNEGIDIENKEAGSSSTTFIPPWLRNSLGLNQRTNLSNLDWSVCLPNFTALGLVISRQAALGSDPKSTKISQRVKEPNQNDCESLRGQNEHSCKILPEDRSQEVNFFKSEDNADNVDAKSDKTIPAYWKDKRKELETNDTNAEGNSNQEQNSRMMENDELFSLDIEKPKDENKTMQKNLKQKNKLKKRLAGERTLEREDLDFLLEMKAKEVIDNCLKKDASSEMQNLETKLLLLSSKRHEAKNTKISEQELTILQEIKNRVGNSAEFENLLQHVRKLSYREVQKPSDLSKIEEKKEDKTIDKNKEDVKSIGDKESVLSTDDENDIKRFSEFLSKNKNLEEKRKCLEEVRNYFEKKRKARLAKRRYAEEGKEKTNEGTEVLPEKSKCRETFRGRKSKFGLCSDEVVEKAVDETLQKFMDLYHISVSPTVVGNMKKNILQAITTEPDESFVSKSTESPLGNKKMLNLAVNEKRGAEFPFVLNKEFTTKEIKKKSFKTLLETPDELGNPLMKETDVMENEKLKRLKKEFDCFLYSIQSHIDVTHLKLQSIVLEKEEPAVSSKNVQFVYNFTKKSLEPEKEDHGHGWRGTSECRYQKNAEVQVSLEKELIKRNVKIQASERKPSCERSLQTEDRISVSQYSQTTNLGMTFKEITELKSSDIASGLYRMVRSNEPGKFYLYPEKVEDKDQETLDGASSSFMKEKKSKKKNSVKALEREKPKEKRFLHKEKGRAKLKRSKKTINKVSPLRKTLSKKEKSESSVNCLYFRNFDRKNLKSLNSKKDLELTDENDRTEEDEDLTVEDTVEMPREPHLGCYWFWNGEKITPGSDLKTHVESLLKEKLKEMTKLELQHSEGNETSKEENNREKSTEENLKFCFTKPENPFETVENEKPQQNEETVAVAEEKSMKNVGTQNSEKAILSLNLSKMKVNSVGGMSDRKKFRRRNIVIRPLGKSMSLKKAENIIKAVEELKKIKIDLEKRKREEDSPDSEFVLDDYASTSGFKAENEDPLSVVLGLPEHEKTSQSDFKNKLKKLMSFVDRDIQTTDTYDVDEANSIETQPTDLNMIKTVLSRAKQKERESLWSDVRDFIKSKIGRDINDEGAQEVCIEIERVPRSEQGKGEKQAIMAKGHYTRDQDDVEVEIDLTLEDLGKILRQKHKKNRKRALYRPRSKKGLSSSSLQSDLTRENLRRYQKYLHRFAALGSGFAQDKAYLEK